MWAIAVNDSSGFKIRQDKKLNINWFKDDVGNTVQQKLTFFSFFNHFLSFACFEFGVRVIIIIIIKIIRDFFTK